MDAFLPKAPDKEKVEEPMDRPSASSLLPVGRYAVLDSIDAVQLPLLTPAFRYHETQA